MTDINVSSYFKLIIAGAVNSGKTTFIKTISEIDPITTDETVTESLVLDKKSQTTVAMDYGKRTIADDVILHLYGTPGQRRFSFMWEILVEGAFGVIFLADSSDPESVKETKYIIEFFDRKFSLPFLVGVTKLDCKGSLSLEEITDIIGSEYALVIPCNSLDINEVKTALITLITLAINRYEA